MKQQYHRSAWIEKLIRPGNQLDAPAVSVALLLVCHMKPDATCSLYIKTIAKELRRSVRYVQIGLQGLESKGWLGVNRTYEQATKRNKSNNFRGIIPGVGENSAPGAQIAPSGAYCAEQGVQNMQAINNNNLTGNITKKGLIDFESLKGLGGESTTIKKRFAHIISADGVDTDTVDEKNEK